MSPKAESSTVELNPGSLVLTRQSPRRDSPASTGLNRVPEPVEICSMSTGIVATPGAPVVVELVPGHEAAMDCRRQTLAQ